MYITLEDVFKHGLESDITWVKVQRAFTFNKHKFDVGHILYIPRRAFERKKSSLTVYSFPEGNLHILPLDIEGDFDKCERKTDKDVIEQCSLVFPTINDRNNNIKTDLIANHSEKIEASKDFITDCMPGEEDEEDNCSTTTSSDSTVSFPSSSSSCSSASSDDDERVEESSALKMIQKPDKRFDGKSNNTHMKSKTLSPTGKLFRSHFNGNATHTIGSHYYREKDGGKKCFDKRFSLFSDKAYVTMASVENFEELCNSHDKKNTSLTQEDYLEMEHPIVNLKLLFPPEDEYEVQVRERSKSDFAREHMKQEENVDVVDGAPSRGRKNVRATKSIGDFSKLLGEEGDSCSLFCIDKEKVKLRSLTAHPSVSDSSNDDIKKSNSTSLYDRLMSEMQVLLTDNEDIQDYDEDKLSRRLGFNRFESRLIYHSIRGWQPNLTTLVNPDNKNTLTSKYVFPEDFSVHELHSFIKSLDNTRLAEYLRKYNIDGYMMEFFVKDDLFLDTMLFDDSFIQVEQLVYIRKKYFPKRPRLNAINERVGDIRI